MHNSVFGIKLFLAILKKKKKKKKNDFRATIKSLKNHKKSHNTIISIPHKKVNAKNQTSRPAA